MQLSEREDSGSSVFVRTTFEFQDVLFGCLGVEVSVWHDTEKCNQRLITHLKSNDKLSD